MPKKPNIHLSSWMELGNSLPNCINIGCSRPVAIRHWSTADGNLLPSLKTECTRCATSRKTGKRIDGITIVKKHVCENKDGILGFTCPIDALRYAEFPSDCYHMDHIDGNHENNVIENIITICSICHARKGKESGDFNGSKKTSRKVRKLDPLCVESYLMNTAPTESALVSSEATLAISLPTNQELPVYSPIETKE